MNRLIPLGIIGTVAVAIIVMASLYYSSVTAATTVTWGPIQTRTVTGVHLSSGGDQLINIDQGAQGWLFIRTTPACLYKPGDTIQYQISSMNYTIGTEQLRLVNPPWSGCQDAGPPF